ncbi:hypothetical protein AVEN_257640-1 [Araneus ventricosus]|uniref:Uncharacterized protein n=1 Tax=Araneus ventricosus TaxID=182803 RepID=A0A4Y2E3P2_ARAVE|nr:hypothetical protein AVEN_257640-1 [Araneus ventricosus]
MSLTLNKSPYAQRLAPNRNIKRQLSDMYHAKDLQNSNFVIDCTKNPFYCFMGLVVVTQLQGSMPPPRAKPLYTEGFLPGASKKNKNLVVIVYRPSTEKHLWFNIKLLAILLRKGAGNLLEKDLFPFFLLCIYILVAHIDLCIRGPTCHRATWPVRHCLKDIPEIFNNPKSTYIDVERAGERFIIALYNNTKKEESNLNKMRYDCFNKLVGQASSAVLLTKLHPTTEAAHQHCRRTFHQVQTWQGHCLNPSSWRWKLVSKSLKPIYTTLIANVSELTCTVLLCARTAEAEAALIPKQ